MKNIIFYMSTLFCGAFLVMQSSDADPPLPTPVGRVVWVQGALKATMPNQEERRLQKTSLIYLNDTLITDHSSQAQIVFTDDTLMTFRSDTTFHIDRYDYHPSVKKGSVGHYVMSLVEGGFRTITGLIAKNNPSDYQVNTPVATIGVRGTDYTTYVHAGHMYMEFYSGTPCVSSGGTVCLSGKTRYAEVPAPGAKPMIVQIQPAVFKEKLAIVPAKIAPFTGGGAEINPTRDTPSNSGLGVFQSPGEAPKSGTISSFCITK